MRVELPNPDQFIIRDCQVFSDDCILIFPKHIGITWDNKNKFFRSSLWRKSDMYPISLGFRKFTNYGESPEFEPLNLKDKLQYVAKKDGSLLIISKYHGQIIVRTRGTIDARTLDNGYEIDLLINKYQLVFDNSILNAENVSLLCEWTTPTNKIVYAESSEPDLWLIGGVYHHDYSYMSQDLLDTISKAYEIQRPKLYSFDTFDEMKVAVEKFEDCEGIVVYSSDGQTLKKTKALKYLRLHRILAGLENEENVIDMFIDQGCPHYSDFYNYFCTNFDYEVAENLRGQISRTVDAWKECGRMIEGMNRSVDEVRKISTRKEQAAHILSSWGNTNRASFAFKMLDNKELNHDDKKKLMFQVMKK